jgi:hypothetical protein
LGFLVFLARGLGRDWDYYYGGFLDFEARDFILLEAINSSRLVPDLNPPSLCGFSTASDIDFFFSGDSCDSSSDLNTDCPIMSTLFVIGPSCPAILAALACPTTSINAAIS